MIELEWTHILVALIGIIPATLALVKAHRTSNSVKLAGSEITVKNWNTLIKNLYGEIDRLTQLNDTERQRAELRESELLREVDRVKDDAKEARKVATAEKRELLRQIEALKNELSILEQRISETINKEQ